MQRPYVARLVIGFPPRRSAPIRHRRDDPSAVLGKILDLLGGRHLLELRAESPHSPHESCQFVRQCDCSLVRTTPRWTPQFRPLSDSSKPAISRSAETSAVYRTAGSVCKSVCVFVRQLRGPHLRTWAWWRSRSRSAVTAAVSPRSLPQSSTGRFDVRIVEARS